MRIQLTPFFVGAIALGSSVTSLTGCRKPAVDTIEPATADSTVTEETENGTIAWSVTPEGQVSATVKAPDGHPITKDIQGTLTWPGDLSDQQRDVAVDPHGTLVASGPKLEDDLTEIDYALTIDGKPWTGVLHVPVGGTRAIDEDAKVAMAVPAGKLGPNGGTLQYIGGSPVELVADRDSQEVRVYVLDNDYAAVDPGDRTFRLGWASSSPGMEVLIREPGQDYYVGRWYTGFDPFRVTLGMTFGGVTHVGIVGWSFGESLRFGVGAPMVGFVGARHWAPSIAVGVGVGFGMGMSARWGMGVAARSSVAVGVGARGGVALGGGARGGVAVGGGARSGAQEHGAARGAEHDREREHGAGEHGAGEHGAGEHGGHEGRAEGHDGHAEGHGERSPGGRGAPSGGGRGAPARSAPARSAPRSGGGRRH